MDMTEAYLRESPDLDYKGWNQKKKVENWFHIDGALRKEPSGFRRIELRGEY